VAASPTGQADVVEDGVEDPAPVDDVDVEDPEAAGAEAESEPDPFPEPPPPEPPSDDVAGIDEPERESVR
jgi:hypothetical protein